MKQPTLKQLKETAKKIGCTVRKHDGEYRVNLIGGNEATASYTDDARDALGTMHAMVLHAKASSLQPGAQILSIAGENDSDEHDNVRDTGPNAVGTLLEFHDDHWSVAFANGTHVRITIAELANPKLYTIK